MVRRPRILAATLAVAIAVAACGSAATPTPAGREPAGSTTYEHTVTAKGIAFDVQAITVKADEPFQIYFRNQDPGSVPHDIDIREARGSKVVEDHVTIDGGKEVVYDFKALPAGTYTFICSVHPIPAMTGTLTVK